jgi:hypothetical protein
VKVPRRHPTDASFSLGTHQSLPLFGEALIARSQHISNRHVRRSNIKVVVKCRMYAFPPFELGVLTVRPIRHVVLFSFSSRRPPSRSIEIPRSLSVCRACEHPMDKHAIVPDPIVAAQLSDIHAGCLECILCASQL